MADDEAKVAALEDVIAPAIVSAVQMALANPGEDVSVRLARLLAFADGRLECHVSMRGVEVVVSEDRRGTATAN